MGRARLRVEEPREHDGKGEPCRKHGKDDGADPGRCREQLQDGARHLEQAPGDHNIGDRNTNDFATSQLSDQVLQIWVGLHIRCSAGIVQNARAPGWDQGS